MIPKGLNVGDTFAYCDGNTYEVTEVIGDQYSVRRVGASAPTSPTHTEGKEEADYNAMPYAQLKKMCAERGLDATGKKEDLISRLK